MADGKVVIKIDGDDSGFADKLTKVSASANDLGNKALKVMAGGLAAGAAALTAGAAAATAAGSAYESAFAKTMTIMDENVVSAQDMSGAIIDLSNNTGQAAAVLSGSVYDAISATGDTAHAVGLVADASKLATAGFAENADALSVLTTITNAYGIEVDKATDISDSLIQTQNLGVTTVGQLASSMGKAIATAAAYSVDLYNLEAAYVATTKAGISTEESTTYLSSMFKELGDSGSDVAKVIQNKTGKSFGTLMKEGVSLGDVLDILLESVNGDTEALMNLWGSAEAGKAASAIAGQGIKSFNANLDSLRNSAGTTEKAYETMTQTLSYQTDLLKTRITNLGTAVYGHFNEGLTAGVSSLSDAFLELANSVTDGALADSMESIGQGVADLISTGAELVSNVLPKIIEAAAWVLDHGGAIVTGIAAITTGILTYKAAVVVAEIATKGFTAALNLNPVGLAVGSIAALTVGIIALGAELNKTDPEVQALNDSNAKTAQTTEAIAEALDTLRSGYQATSAEIQGAKETNDRMIDSLARLIEEYDGTAGAAAVIEKIVGDLNNAIPGLNLEFDKQSGALNRSEEAMRALNAEYAAREQFDAAQNARTDAENELAAAHKNVENAARKVAKAQKEAADYAELYGTTGELAAAGDVQRATKAADLEQAIQDATEEQQRAIEAEKEAYYTYNDTGKALENAEKAYSDATDAAAEFTDETEDNADALDQQAQAAKEATQSVAKIALKAQEATQSGKNLGDTYEDLRKDLDDLKGSGDPYIESLAEQALKQLDAAAKAEELGTKYGELSGIIGVSTAEVAGYLAAADMSFDDFAASADSAMDSTINGFSKMSTSLDMSLSEMAANLDANIQATSSWNDNIAILWNAAVVSGQAGATEFVKQLYDMGPAASAQVAQMVQDVDGNLATFAPLFADAGAESVEQAAIGAAMAGNVMYDASSAVMAEAVQAVEETDFQSPTATAMSTIPAAITAQAPAVQAAASELAMTAHSAMAQVGWADLGSAIGTGISGGITAQTGTVQTAAQTLTQSVSDAWTQSAGKFRQSGTTAGTQIKTGLTSQKSNVTAAGRSLAEGVTSAWSQSAARFQSTGTAAAASIAGGISSGSGGITSAAASAAYSAYGAVGGLSWYSLGYNISAGIASGVRAGSGLITSAARSAAYSALQAAKSSLDIRSPSRVFRDQVGQMIPSGIALGIEQGTPQAEKALELSAGQLLRATQIALRPSGSVSPAQSITNNAYYGGGTGDGILKAEAPVIINLDGREVGRGTAKFTGQRMAYLGGLS